MLLKYKIVEMLLELDLSDMYNAYSHSAALSISQVNLMMHETSVHVEPLLTQNITES